MFARRVSSFFCLVAVGCRSSVPSNDIGVLDTGSVPEETTDTSVYDGATLRILSPVSASLVPWGEESEFSAAVFGSNGEPMAFTDVVWSSDLDETWVRTGATFDDDSLDVGVHALTAEAILPNGDRISAVVGGIRVQHKDAGVYMGEARVDILGDYKGQELSGACFGITTMVVDVYGEKALGDTDCTISFLGYDMAMAFDIDLDVLEEGELDGTAEMDFDLFAWPFSATGRVGDGELQATWGDSVVIAEIAAALDLVRVNDDPSWQP